MKFPKVLQIVCIMLFLPLVSYAQKCTKISIEFVDFDIESIVSINCANFETEFRDEMQKIDILEPKEIKKICRKLNNLIPDSSKGTPDVRMKIRFFEANIECRVACLDQLKLAMDNKMYKVGRNFLLYLKALTKKHNIRCPK